MPLNYRQVKDIHDELVRSGTVTQPLPEWSSEMNRLSESDLYSAGLSDNFIKQASVSIDRLLEATGLPQVGAEFGREVGGIVGRPEFGEELGRGLPRGVVNFLPMFLPLPGVGPAATAALSGAEAYTASGSPAAGILAGAANVAMPGVARAAEQGALRALGVAPITGRVPVGSITDLLAGGATRAVSERIPTTLEQGVLSQAAGQLGAGALGVGSELGQQALAGEPLRVDPLEQLLNLTLGQAPFAALYATKGGRAALGGETSQARAAELKHATETTETVLDFHRKQEEIKNKLPIEGIPPPVDVVPLSPTKLGELNARLNQLYNRQQELQKEPSSLSEDEWNEASKEINEILRTQQGARTDTVAGTKIDSKTERIVLTGTEIRTNKAGTGRLIRVADIDENGPYAGKEIWYSTLHEPRLNPGEYSIPVGFATESAWTKKPSVVEGQPELPTQAEPGVVTPARFSDVEQVLREAETELTAAKSESDKRKATQKLNAVREMFDLAPYTDVQLAAKMKKQKLKSDKEATQSAISETRRLLEERERRQVESAAYTADLEVRRQAGDPAAQQIHELRQTFIELGARGGENSNYARVVAQGKFDEAAKKWEATDPKRDIENLKAMFAENIAQGTGLKRVEPTEPTAKADATVIADVKAAEAAHPLDALPLVETIRANAMNHADGISDPVDQAEYIRAVEEGNFSRAQEILNDYGVNFDFQRLAPGGPSPLPPGAWGLYTRARNIGPWAENFVGGLVALRDDKTNPYLSKIAYEFLARLGESEPKPRAGELGVPRTSLGLTEALTVWDRELAERGVVGPSSVDLQRLAPESDLVWDSTTDRFITKQEFNERIRGQELQSQFSDLITQAGHTGFSLWKFLGREGAHPELRAIMRDLAKFSGSLERINVFYQPKSGLGAAIAGPARRNQIMLGRHLLNYDPVGRDWIIAHELMHGLTQQELNNPTNAKIKAQFSALRQEAIKRLPRAMADTFKEVGGERWYERYQFGLASSSDLGEAASSERAILYAMMNDDEFIAQGFSSKPFQDWMRSQKSTTGESYYHRFVNWVKELLGLGKIDATLFEEFMSKADQVLDQNNYIARIHNYGERYLEQAGVAPELARSQTERALGLLQHNVDVDVTAETILATALNQVSMRGSVIRAYEQYARMPPEDLARATEIFTELGYTPNTPEAISDLLFEGTQGLDLGPILDMLPEAASGYLFELARDTHQVVDTLRAMTRDKIANRLAIATPDKIREPAEATTKALEKILALDDEHSRKIRELQGMSAVSPAGFLDRAGEYVRENREFLTKAEINSQYNQGLLTKQERDAALERAARGEPAFPPIIRYALGADEKTASTWMERFLEKPAQFARRHPEVAEFVSKGYQLLANSRHMAMAGFRSFGLDLSSGQITPDSTAKFLKSLGNKKVTHAVDRWIYWNQKKGEDTVVTLPVSDPDVARELQGLSSDERQTAIDIMAKKEASQKLMNAQILEKMLQVGAVNAATLIQHHTGLKSGQNLSLAEAIMQVVTLPPEQLATDRAANAKLALVQSKLQPEVFLNLFKFAQGEGEKWLLHKQYFDANPGWNTAQRFGKFDLEYRRGGKVLTDAVDSKREAQEVAQGGEIIRLERRARQTDDQSPHIGSDFHGILERLRELEQNQAEIQQAAGRSPEDIAQWQKDSPIEQMAFETQYGRGVPLPNVRARRLTKGAEELPWLSNHFSWIHKSSTYWSRQLFRAQARMLRGDPELVARPDLQQWTQQHSANILSPDPEVARVASRFTTTWLMGFNAASALANGTQLLNRGVAELTSLTGRPLESYKRVGAAASEIINWAKTGQWGSPEHKKLVDRLYHDGEVNLSMYDEEMGLQELMGHNFKRHTVRGKPHTLGQFLSNAGGAYSTASMWMFRNVERFNNIGASLAAFDLHRSQGLSFDEAYVKATEFNHAVNDVGGRVNRSVGLFAGKDDFSRSAAMLSNSMQSYVLGSTWQLVNYLKSGWFRPQGLKPHEVYSARKAAIQMLATQFAFAGTLGMPFVSGALSLLDSQFPELELNRHLREFVAGLFQDDEGNGSPLSDIAMTGLPSMMGWDWQSRLSMGNTVPGVSEINGFQPELLLGAPVNVVSNFVTGAYRTGTGMGRGLAGVDRMLFPPFVRKMLDLANSGGTHIKDYRDRPVLEATRGQQLGMIFGFQPKELSDINAAGRILQQAEEVSKMASGQYHSTIAEEVLRGNFGSARAALLDRAQQDAQYNPQEGARAVARVAEEMTFVRDLRREGTSRTGEIRSKLLSAFGLDRTEPGEVARFKFRQQVEQRLGLPPSASSSRELVLAGLVDQLRAARPDATRLELRRVAEAALRGPRNRSLLPVSQ